MLFCMICLSVEGNYLLNDPEQRINLEAVVILTYNCGSGTCSKIELSLSCAGWMFAIKF